MILGDTHLGRRIKKCILTTAMVSKPEYTGKAWGRNPSFVKQLQAVYIAETNNKPGCSMIASDTVFRADLGIHPLGNNRLGVKLKSQYTERNMPRKILQP